MPLSTSTRVFFGGCTSIHFGENQLSPRSVGISPLSTAHPPVLQHWWVRASTDCHIRFTLAMESSRGFGSHRGNFRPLQTRFPSGSPALPPVNLLPPMHSPDHSTKGTPLVLARTLRELPLTACEYVVSGSLSFPSRGAFHLSLTVLVHYRSLAVFSLGEWSPLLPTRLHVSRGTQDQTSGSFASLYRTLTSSGRAFQRVRVCSLPCFSCLSYNPRYGYAVPGLGSSRFARHYFGNLF